MSAPRFQRGRATKKRDFTEDDLAEFDARLDACEAFCEAVNDHLHDVPEEESPEEKTLREIIMAKVSKAVGV